MPQQISLSFDLLKLLDGVELQTKSGPITIICQDDYIFLSNSITGELTQLFEKELQSFFNRDSFKIFIEDYCPKVLKFGQRDHGVYYIAKPLYVETDCSSLSVAIWISGGYILKTKKIEEWHCPEVIIREKVILSLSSIFSNDWTIELPTQEEINLFIFKGF